MTGRISDKIGQAVCHLVARKLGAAAIGVKRQSLCRSRTVARHLPETARLGRPNGRNGEGFRMPAGRDLSARDEGRRPKASQEGTATRTDRLKCAVSSHSWDRGETTGMRRNRPLCIQSPGFYLDAPEGQLADEGNW